MSAKESPSVLHSFDGTRKATQDNFHFLDTCPMYFCTGVMIVISILFILDYNNTTIIVFRYRISLNHSSYDSNSNSSPFSLMSCAMLLC